MTNTQQTTSYYIKYRLILFFPTILITIGLFHIFQNRILNISMILFSIFFYVVAMALAYFNKFKLPGLSDRSKNENLFLLFLSIPFSIFYILAFVFNTIPSISVPGLMHFTFVMLTEETVMRFNEWKMQRVNEKLTRESILKIIMLIFILYLSISILGTLNNI